jgi:hypothetical protein
VFTEIIVRDPEIFYVPGIPIHCDWFKVIPLNDCCTIIVYEIKIKLGYCGDCVYCNIFRRFVTMLAADRSGTFQSQSKLIVTKIYDYFKYWRDNAFPVL